MLQASKEISYFLRKDPSELEKEQRMIPVRVGVYSLPVIHAVQMKALSWDALDALATKGPLCNDEYLKVSLIEQTAVPWKHPASHIVCG